MGQFAEDMTKFFLAQLVISIGYLHSNNIVHRDLKLENILLEEDGKDNSPLMPSYIGYIRLIDFGISKQLDFQARQHSYSVRGTPEYMAPETIDKSGHSFPVDWWALGIVAYEMLVGQPPFYQEDQDEMFNSILNEDIAYPEDIEINEDTKEFISLLLNKDSNARLGAGGYEEVMGHRYFDGFDFSAVTNKTMEPPYKPELSDDLFDVSNFESDLIMQREAGLTMAAKKSQRSRGMSQFQKEMAEFHDRE
jgi:serum/glucocorticoid-regulated kinase 2